MTSLVTLLLVSSLVCLSLAVPLDLQGSPLSPSQLSVSLGLPVRITYGGILNDPVLISTNDTEATFLLDTLKGILVEVGDLCPAWDSVGSSMHVLDSHKLARDLSANFLL